MQFILDVFRHHPELAVFLTLALGFWLGNLQAGGFKLGTVTGVLLAGILVGRMHLHVPSAVEAVFFLLFLFTIGYSVGPQFFAGLKKDGLPQAGFAVIICCLSLGTAYLMARIFGFDAGTGAGLLSGANTSSAIIGVSSDTISNMNIDEQTRALWLQHVPVAYAVTYIFGTAGTAWFLAVFAPRFMLGPKVPEKIKELESQLNAGSDTDEEGGNMLYNSVTFRAYRINNDWFNTPQTVQSLEAFLALKHKTVFVLRVRKEGEVVPKTPDTALQQNDVITLSGDRTQMLHLSQYIGEEIAAPEMLNFPLNTRHAIVTSKAVLNVPIHQLRRSPFFYGVSIRNLQRGEIDLPVQYNTRLQKGDILELVGVKEDLDVAVKHTGYAEKTGIQTDIVFLCLGIVLGGVIGSLALQIGKVPVSLSTSGGTLIMGLVFGWLRSRRPAFGYIPAPSQWLLSTLGLNLFIAVVGINASEGFIVGLQQLGLELFAAGMVVSILPMVAGLLLGRFVFKFHPAITLGACAGAHTETAALGAIQDALKSNTPALGYTVTYAVSNTILATWGIVMVRLLA